MRDRPAGARFGAGDNKQSQGRETMSRSNDSLRSGRRDFIQAAAVTGSRTTSHSPRMK